MLANTQRFAGLSYFATRNVKKAEIQYPHEPIDRGGTMALITGVRSPVSLKKIIRGDLIVAPLSLAPIFFVLKDAPPSKINRTKGNTKASRATHPVYYVEEIKGIILVCN